MSKLLRNTTLSDIFISDVGVNIPLSSTYETQPTDSLLWAGSDELVVHLGSGDLIGNDGSRDLTPAESVKLFQGLYPDKIGIEGVNTSNGAMDVNAQVNVSVELDENPGCSVLSNKAVIDSNSSDISFGTSFTQIYSYSGTGKLANFLMRFNTDDCNVKLTVDGNQVFDINLDAYEKLLDMDHNLNNSWLNMNHGDKSISFRPNCPIQYTSSVLIEVKSDKKTKKVYDYIVCLTKES